MLLSKVLLVVAGLASSPVHHVVQAAVHHGALEGGLADIHDPRDEPTKSCYVRGGRPTTTTYLPALAPTTTALQLVPTKTTAPPPGLTATTSPPLGGNPAQTTIAMQTTATTNTDGTTATIVVIRGGPITTPITLASGPAPTPLDPTGEAARSIIASLSSALVSSVLPQATSWAQFPEPARATAAIQAIESVLPQLGGLANSLPNGQAIFVCPVVTVPTVPTVRRRSKSPKGRRDAQALVKQLHDMNCDILDLLGGIESGQQTRDPAILGPIIVGVQGSAGRIPPALAAVASQVGVTGPSGTTTTLSGSPPTNTTTTQVGIGVPAGTTTTDTTTAIVPIHTGWPSGWESSITSTMTILPPGASIQTLTGGFTEGAVITTTSPGSNDPTVVPVIVPVGGGPPLICWGCVPFFPISIQVKLPEFCIDILGIKIGNCGGGGGGGGGGGNGGDPPGKQDDPPKSDQPTGGPTTRPTTSAESTTATCSVTVTATYESVFCSVTGLPPDPNGPDEPERRRRRGVVRREAQAQTTGCSTLAYSTITGCDTVTANTTTTTTTTYPTLYCAPETCGGGSGGGTCDAANKNPHVKRVPPEPVPTRNPEPAENTWADPANYGGDRKRFMRGEVALAYEEESEQTQVPLGGEDDIHWSSHNYITFGNQVQTLAVAGLYGCTSVVAVSRKGAWASHFWEVPSFDIPPGFMERYRYTSGEEWFKSDVLGTLGADEPEGPRYNSQWGLGHLRNKDDKGDLGHMFDDANQPRIFIMVPRIPELTPGGKWSNSETAGGSESKYPEHVKRIKLKLKEIFPNLHIDLEIKTIQYSPMQKPVMVIVDPTTGERNEAFGDEFFLTHRGKLLIQYQPASKPCQPKAPPEAKWRVFFEKNGDAHDEWMPAVGQQLQRRDDSCQNGGDGATSTAGIPTPTTTEVGAIGAPMDGGSSGSGPGQCKSAADCMPAVICMGHTVNQCRDGKCVCDGPTASPPPPVCTTADECVGKIECVGKTVRTCDESKQCVCLAPPPAPPVTATAPPLPPPTMTTTQAAPTEKPTCTLHLHQHANSFDSPVKVEWSLNRDGKSWYGDWTQAWGEEHVITPDKSALAAPVSVRLTRKLPPGVEDLDCPEKGGGGDHFRKRCPLTQYKLWLIELKYADLAWDSRPGQELGKTPHCQVEAWDEGFNGVLVDRSRQMDCRFVC